MNARKCPSPGVVGASVVFHIFQMAFDVERGLTPGFVVVSAAKFL
jgi:hypothetical protein